MASYPPVAGLAGMGDGAGSLVSQEFNLPQKAWPDFLPFLPITFRPRLCSHDLFLAVASLTGQEVARGIDQATRTFGRGLACLRTSSFPLPLRISRPFARQSLRQFGSWARSMSPWSISVRETTGPKTNA